MMRKMPALPRNSRAPDFTLADADGREFNLYDALRDGPVLLTFFKTDCPTCQYGLPFIDRLATSLDGSAATPISVSQDTAREGEMFKLEFDYATRQVFDPQWSGYEVSNAYGLTNVPTVFLVAPDGRIAHTMVSWSKADVEEIARKLGVGAPFRPGESVLPFRPG